MLNIRAPEFIPVGTCTETTSPSDKIELISQDNSVNGPSCRWHRPSQRPQFWAGVYACGVSVTFLDAQIFVFHRQHRFGHCGQQQLWMLFPFGKSVPLLQLSMVGRYTSTVLVATPWTTPPVATIFPSRKAAPRHSLQPPPRSYYSQDSLLNCWSRTIGEPHHVGTADM